MTWIESHAAALDRSVLSLFGKSTSPPLPILILHGDLARPDAPLPARDIERRFASIAALGLRSTLLGDVGLWKRSCLPWISPQWWPLSCGVCGNTNEPMDQEVDKTFNSGSPSIGSEFSCA